MIHLESFVPLAGKLGTPANRFVPNNRKIGARAKVLGNCDCVVKI